MVTLSMHAATLEHSPGTAVEIFVTYLTSTQLQRMHETEGAYFLVELRGLQLYLGTSLEAHRQALWMLFMPSFYQSDISADSSISSAEPSMPLCSIMAGSVFTVQSLKYERSPVLQGEEAGSSASANSVPIQSPVWLTAPAC